MEELMKGAVTAEIERPPSACPNQWIGTTSSEINLGFAVQNVGLHGVVLEQLVWLVKETGPTARKSHIMSGRLPFIAPNTSAGPFQLSVRSNHMATLQIRDLVAAAKNIKVTAVLSAMSKPYDIHREIRFAVSAILDDPVDGALAELS
ncbi:hypothetical protein [Nannocystis sp.]|uniref:hypothetical protein n=1 Tax=Nannocystis sp. TaxID=1962667 RepID=UPI0025FC6662|nr:hypothetical protein [Nannocystis sp.]MBK7828420.1 hypothetical protein [Nannocystis sp.]